MARKVPDSPARADAALDQVLDKAPRPAMPPGLAARIVAQATALPQLPAESVTRPEPAAPRETAQVISFAVPEPVVPAPSRKRFAAGGFAAIAATVAAVVLMGQPGQKAVTSGAPVATIARTQTEASQPAVAPTVGKPATQLAKTTATRTRSESAAVSAKEADAPAVPALATQPPVVPETQLAATAAPAPRESAGSKPDPSPRPTSPRGLMGPPAPQQGWGFSGGVPGGTLPGGQALPSQTTGSAPPPPPPPGN